MERKAINPLMMAATIVWTLVTFAAVADGEVTFYTQREGAAGDTGHATYLAVLGEFDEVDFEDDTPAPLGGAVPEMWFGDLGILIEGDWGGPYVPTIVTSSEFDVEGEIWQRALLAGFGLTVRPAAGTRLDAFGLWLFDDGKTVDAAYLMEAVEEDGTVWEMVLENEIPQNQHRHEIEGFIGVVSDAGLLSVTITPINPATGDVVIDVFETDHWIIVVDVLPPPPDPTDLPPGQQWQRQEKENRPFQWNGKRLQHRRHQRPEQNAAGPAAGRRGNRLGNKPYAIKPGAALKNNSSRRPEYGGAAPAWQRRNTDDDEFYEED